MNKWKIGDTVYVDDELSMFDGEKGVVSHFNEDLYHNVFVRFKDNSECNFRHKELKAE